jgi:hypothetical protein
VNNDVWVSRGFAASMTGVSPDAIGKWHARGWVDQHGVRRHLRTRPQGNGRLLYRIGDILEAELDTHLSGKGHRGATRVAA